MPKKIINAPFNSYFGVFLTLGCNLNCDYCVQKISLPRQPQAHYPLVAGRIWTEALNSITPRRKKKFLWVYKKKKISITGGAPSLHPDFIYILNHLDRDWRITVTSNFCTPFFKDAGLLRQLKRRRGLKFNASYHFLYTPLDNFIENLIRVKRAGIFVHTVFIVGHPDYAEKIKYLKEKIAEIHPLVKTQRFLGYYGGELYPRSDRHGLECEQKDGIFNYAFYQEGFGQKEKKDIYCRMNKVLFAPNGDIYNCHYKLYTGHQDKLGNLFEDNVHIVLPREYFLCHDFGFCNPCDSEGHAFKGLDGRILDVSEES
jgi:MoaA/NifB/PqqE/SkfB family radical SAM enzyme